MNRTAWSLAVMVLCTPLHAAPALPVTRPALPPATGLPTVPGLPQSPLAGAEPLTSAVQSTLPGLLRNPLLPADLLAAAQAVVPVTGTLPALPTAAPCRFGGGSIDVNFGQIPAGADAREFGQALLLQVECSQATEFMISSQEPPLNIGSDAERSAIPVTLRNQTEVAGNIAWALLEQDGQPLASRRFSVPAASPTLIAVTAYLLASPTSRQTPGMSGELESLMLARQLYLIDATSP